MAASEGPVKLRSRMAASEGKYKVTLPNNKGSICIGDNTVINTSGIKHAQQQINPTGTAQAGTVVPQDEQPVQEESNQETSGDNQPDNSTGGNIVPQPPSATGQEEGKYNVTVSKNQGLLTIGDNTVIHTYGTKHPEQQINPTGTAQAGTVVPQDDGQSVQEESNPETSGDDQPDNSTGGNIVPQRPSGTGQGGAQFQGEMSPTDDAGDSASGGNAGAQIQGRDKIFDDETDCIIKKTVRSKPDLVEQLQNLHINNPHSLEGVDLQNDNLTLQELKDSVAGDPAAEALVDKHIEDFGCNCVKCGSLR